jgi:hypothetical protein
MADSDISMTMSLPVFRAKLKYAYAQGVEALKSELAREEVRLSSTPAGLSNRGGEMVPKYGVRSVDLCAATSVVLEKCASKDFLI